MEGFCSDGKVSVLFCTDMMIVLWDANVGSVLGWFVLPLILFFFFFFCFFFFQPNPSFLLTVCLVSVLFHLFCRIQFPFFWYCVVRLGVKFCGNLHL